MSAEQIRLPPFAHYLGIEIVEADQEHVVGRLPVRPEHANGHDRVHGGAIMALADTVGAIGAVLNLPPGTTTTTLESKTNFLAPGRAPYLVGEATPLHVGRTTMVWQTTVRNDDGRRVAVVTQTQLVLPMADEAPG
jgi:1,4-dihydroxy-2-naphthoyl-CoA hydrolase